MPLEVDLKPVKIKDKNRQPTKFREIYDDLL